MINSPVFFIRTVEDYEASCAPWAGQPLRVLLRRLLLRPGAGACASCGWPSRRSRGRPGAPWTPQYHSLSAFKLGPGLNVKYSAKPCACRGARAARERATTSCARPSRRPRRRRRLLRPARAAPGGGEEHARRGPHDRWREKDSPFVKVARVTIPRQAFDTPEQNAFCEALSFTPWHALPEHRRGRMNRLRKAVYREISRYRHAKNGRPSRRAEGLLPRPHPRHLRMRCNSFWNG